jgi:hypothetical protein
MVNAEFHLIEVEIRNTYAYSFYKHKINDHTGSILKDLSKLTEEQH